MWLLTDAVMDLFLFGAVLLSGYHLARLLLAWRYEKEKAERRRRLRKSSSIGSMSPEHTPSSELQRVEKLRQRVMRNGNADKLPGGARWYDDIELLRFVRARKTLDESEELLESSLAWRLENLDCLGIRTANGSFGAAYADFVSGASAPPAWWSFLQSQGLQTLIGSDKNGLPITYVAVGSGDFAGCEREVGLQALLVFFIMLHDRFLDLAWRRAAASGASASDAPHGGIFIVDLQGLGLRHYKELRILKRVAALSNAVIPERTRSHFLINAPPLFASLWPMFRKGIHARTQAKINIIGVGQSLDPLFEEIGPENVPTFLGGDFTGLQQPSGKPIESGAFAAWQRKHPAAAAAEKPQRSPTSTKLPISPILRKRRFSSRWSSLTPCAACMGGG